MTDLADIECPRCGSALCDPYQCALHTPRRHDLALTPAATVDDPDWAGGRPIAGATA